MIHLQMNTPPLELTINLDSYKYTRSFVCLNIRVRLGFREACCLDLLRICRPFLLLIHLVLMAVLSEL